MTVKDEYIQFKTKRGLKTSRFEDRVRLQGFIRDRLDLIWAENPGFTNGGLFKNQMTDYAMGFAYYDCHPSQFCRKWCYGLPITGIADYNMFRLAVITSESLKTGDSRYLASLYKKLKALTVLKIGHWGDATLEQVPVLGQVVRDHPRVTFWWYTRKQAVALLANRLKLPNLRVYLSLDPATPYPLKDEYPYGLTYLFGDRQRHRSHKTIMQDERLVAVFPLKRGNTIEDPWKSGSANHPKLCTEKISFSESRAHGGNTCFFCKGRCNFGMSGSA